MLDKLRAVQSRFEELEFKSGLPDFYADPNKAAKLLRERNDLEPIVTCYRDYLAAVQEQREAEELMEEVRSIAIQAINDCLDRRDRVDRMELKACVKDTLSKYLYSKTKRKPMVLPVIMNV